MRTPIRARHRHRNRSRGQALVELALVMPVLLLLDDFVSEPLSVGTCTASQQAAGTCGVIGSSPFGAYLVKLID